MWPVSKVTKRTAHPVSKVTKRSAHGRPSGQSMNGDMGQSVFVWPSCRESVASEQLSRTMDVGGALPFWVSMRITP